MTVLSLSGGSRYYQRLYNFQEHERILSSNYFFFSPTPREMFYCIAWTTLFVELVDPPQMNILAAAGARGTLHLVHPDGGVAFLEHRITRSQKVTVSSLLFHPKHCSILFCKLRLLATFLF